MAKTYALTIANKEIIYTINKKKNCKRIILKVLHGELIVTAPSSLSDAYVNAFILEKKDWITEHLMNQGIEKTKISNASVLYFRGIFYSVFIEFEERKTIKIIEDITTTTLYFHVPFLTSDDKIIQAYKRFLRKEAEVLLQDRLQVLKHSKSTYAIMNQYLKNYRVRFLKTAFGLCYPRKSEIVLNAELVIFEPIYMDYVILHELTHFLHQNHSKEFYFEFEKLDPHWKQHKKELNSLHQQHGGWSRK